MLVEKITESLLAAYTLRSDDLVILGFSGGADSACLLDVFAKINFRIHIAYFNHQLRESVDQEIQFVKNTAKRYSVESSIGSENISALAKKNNKGIEETARFYRYQFLIETAKKYKAVAVAVAHHADDQIETILMNMIRGAGLNGLIGMEGVSISEFSSSIPIIRPMLGIWKSEILDYCQEKNLSFSTDETNSDERFTRNKIRGSLIPLLEKINPQIKQSINRMGTILRDDHQFILDYSEKVKRKLILDARKNFVKIDALAYKKQSVSVQRTIINYLLNDYFYLGKNKSFNLIESIRKVINGDISGNYSKLLVNLQVLVEGNICYLFLDFQDLKKQGDLELVNEGVRLKKNSRNSINKTCSITSKILPIAEVKEIYPKNTNMNVAYLDADSVGVNISLEKWKSGMKFAPLGLFGHSMKLSDFWINKGFPKRKRDNWPLVIADDKIIWIPGFQPSYSARITDTTTQVLKLTVEKV
jgi:tRNA(Ile)-lysidine synthase